MRFLNWKVKLSVLLILASTALYFIHYLIFRDAYHIFLYLIGDIAFIPIDVLLVVLVIHQLLSAREKRSMLKKLNMVVGAFYSEVGTGLLKYFCAFDPEVEKINKQLLVSGVWTGKEFKKRQAALKARQYNIDFKRGGLEELRTFLVGRREFLLRLLENPNLLEHETFTELLWAVFHLTEELVCRISFEHLPAADYDHLKKDTMRAYRLLIFEWLSYMEHLSTDYPYLFSLAMRTNPFDPAASPIIS